MSMFPFSEDDMRKLGLIVVVLAIGVGIGFWISNRRAAVEGQAKPGAGFAAIPGSLGSEDLTGPYEVVKGWPKDISTLPGNEKWTYGAGESGFAESPNRIYMLFRGELPKMAPPKAALLPQLGPSISFPVAGFWRDATVASLPVTGGTDNNMAEWMTAWEGKAPDIGIKGPPYRKLGVDANWENCLVVVDGNGNIIETWKQWDSKFRRPHSVYISPYDPDRNVWVVDDNMQVIYRFTHDGKQLLQTIGTPEKEGAVETRPGYFSNVHGIAIDQKTRQVFVNDRNNHRIQVFDENGKYLREWKIDASPSSLHLLYIGSGNSIWTFDRTTNKMVEWDLQGHLLYSWGSMGAFPGGLWGVHGVSVDQDGNLYVAEVDAGRVQKFAPKPGANPAFMLAKPIYSAWKD